MRNTAIVKYTLLTAVRDWLYLGILLLVFGSIFLSIFLGSTALSEQGKASIVFIAGSVRIITILGLVLFVCFHVRRSIENKEIEMILTRPISRLNFVLTYYLSFAVLALSLVLPIALILCISVLNFSFVDIDHDKIDFMLKNIGLWSFSFFLETLIVISFAFFATLILESAVFSTLATLTFYFLSRIIGFFMISMHNPTSLIKSTMLGRVSENTLMVISTMLPRLDMFSKSEWLVYGVNNSYEYLLFSASALVFIPLILTMTIFDFLRKQF